MTLKGRRRLFYSLVAVFLIVGTGAIFYAQGWRFTVSPSTPLGFTFKKIGAIFVRPYPQDADIYLNGKIMKKSTGIFANGTLLNNLIPKNYILELKAFGYQSWRERVDVNPSLVTEEKYAVLVPQEPATLQFQAGKIQNFWVINHAPLIENSAGDLIANGTALAGNTVIAWRDDSRNVITKDTKTGAYFTNDIENGTSTAITGIIQNAGFPKSPTEKQIAIDPADSNNLIFTKPAAIEIRDTRTGERVARLNSTSSIIASAASRAAIAWMTFDPKNNSSTLNLYEIASGFRRNAVANIPGKTAELAWIDADRLGILQNGEFFVYTRNENILSHLASDVLDFVWDADHGMIATFENRSVEIFSLEDKKQYWRFNLPEMSTVRSLAWYRDGRHLFIAYPDRVAFLDLQDLSGENIRTVAETKHSFYDSPDNKFYFIKNGDLMELEFAK